LKGFKRMKIDAVLGKYSIGIGDRFGMEGRAQLRAAKRALSAGVEVTPVWNKSNREHSIIGTEPDASRAEADDAVKAESWSQAYFVDADHIGLKTVDRFLPACDFFTIDVADYIGKPADDKSVEEFLEKIGAKSISVRHPDLSEELTITADGIRKFAVLYLRALDEAGAIYQYIKRAKAETPFIAEVSMDEALEAQSPAHLYLILAGLAIKGVAVQTIAPKFSGKFLKGIDYIGDVRSFAEEFRNDLAVITAAKDAFNLSPSLKLSVHSGSDKFSLYPHIHSILKRTNSGVHLKTAGTTWLEEVIGLAASEKNLRIAQHIYANAYERREELRKPYETVVEVDDRKLPHPGLVARWSSKDFVSALKHDQKNPLYNSDFRQLVHIAFRIAAESGDEFRKSLIESREIIERHVEENLFDRHIRPLFLER
jgi:hypothetical protein